MKVDKFKRGQVWWYKNTASFDGSVMGKTRPMIIISNNLANRHSTNLIAVPCTTTPKSPMPTHVLFKLNGTESTALCENIMSVNVEKLTDYIGTADDEIMCELDKCIKISLALCNDEETSVSVARCDMETVNCRHTFPVIDEDTTITIHNIAAASPTGEPLTKMKRAKSKNMPLEDKIRFMLDIENHDNDYMIKKYNLKDNVDLAKKKYLYRKQLTEKGLL